MISHSSYLIWVPQFNIFNLETYRPHTLRPPFPFTNSYLGPQRHNGGPEEVVLRVTYFDITAKGRVLKKVKVGKGKRKAVGDLLGSFI